MRSIAEDAGVQVTLVSATMPTSLSDIVGDVVDVSSARWICQAAKIMIWTIYNTEVSASRSASCAESRPGSYI